MPNPFAIGGAQPERASKFAPLLVNRFWSGQYSNSSPLSEPTVPYLYQRFYSGSRYETIRSGSNIEISPRLTLIRRPGISVYNSQTFPACTTFYEFRVFNSITRTEQIRVIADTATAVYDATGPSTKTLLWTKLTGAGQTSFQSVANTLYAADGVSAWKWLWNPPWQANTTFPVGTVIIDSNGNLQKAAGWLFNNNIDDITVASNVLTVETTATTYPRQQTAIGNNMILTGLTTATFINSQKFPVSGTGLSNFELLGPITHADYARAADTGAVFVDFACSADALVAPNPGLSGGSAPSWSATVGQYTIDNGIIWVCVFVGSVQSWGIVAPTAAPQVSNALLPSGNAWAASTYYWPQSGAIILDSNGNLQLLTTAGTTSTVPSWAVTPGVTTTDGTAVWTCQGSATRGTTTSYALGTWIAVKVTTVIRVLIGYAKGDPQLPLYSYSNVTNYYFYTCSVAGTTSATATTNLVWPTSLGGTLVDGTVTWLNAGYEITRTASATVSPSSNAQGNVGNTTAVTTVSSIIDSAGSGGGSGFIQNVTLAGISGSTPPTWTTAGSPAVESAGLLTHEASGLQWTNGGQSGAPNTGTWIYGYSFLNSITGHESSMSLASIPILLAAASGIAVSGSGDPNWASDGVDTIRIYRSVQGFTTPFKLTDLPAPLLGAAWSYLDASPDPPDPASVLNEFISADTTGNNAPPPAGLTNLTFYLSRVFGSTGTFQYYSGVAGQLVGVGAESWGGLNYAQLPEVVTRSWASSTGLLIFTTYGVFLSQGIDGNGNPSTPVQILHDIGLLSINLFTVNGSIPVLLTSDMQMLSLDPSTGITRYSDPIADSTNGMGGFSPTASYLTWHVNGIDSAFYLADGSTGWFRLNPTAAPESGFTWSPKAGIVGGCGALRSVETSPGVKNLLISPAGGGKIFKRDLTTNADNGSTYAANVVIGSLVFAQPNQCAEIRSLSTYAVAIGAHPTVGILGDEISGSFATLTGAVPEPPFLVSATSVYNDRWYFSVLAQPIWLQHMQIKFSWPAENFSNELLSFGIYGCVHILDS